MPGVGDVIVFGERKFAMRLWLDPTKLAGRSITAGDVLSALREQNVQVAAGALGDAPAPAEQDYTISVRAMGRLSEAPQFEDVVVKAGKDGALVRVKDVGRVELGAETYSSNLRFLGLEAQGIGISLLPSANAIEVFQRRGRGDGSPQAELPAGPRMAGRLRQRRRRARVDHRSAVDAARSDRPRHPGDVPVPAELAQHDHSRRSPSRCR